MSLLIVNQWEDEVEILTDTLVVDEANTPVWYQRKVAAFSESRMLIAATGTAEIASAWTAFLAETQAGRTIDQIDEIAPKALRNIYAELARRVSDPETATIYHYGNPAGSDRVVLYTYTNRDGRDFESERFEGNRFSAKPGPQTFDLEVAETLEERVVLAYRIRDEQAALAAEGKPTVPIGGELHLTRLARGVIQTIPLHRFPDYNEALPSFV